MNECSTDGVCFYSGNIPPEGTYRNIQNGKEPCLVMAAGIIAFFAAAFWLLAMVAF